jgi:hypothetical protein
MVKRFIILFTFLAYSLTLTHSLVPHHHDDDLIQSELHHDEASSGHHDDDSDNSNDQLLSHFFSDAVHHPSADIAIHSSQSENVTKDYGQHIFLVPPFTQLLLPDLEPPDVFKFYQAHSYSIHLFSASHLRAPPAV